MELGYDATNLLSCMTLDVENLHSVVHLITRVRSLQLCSMHATLAVQQKRASNEQQRDWPITTQGVGRGTQCQRGRWACLKFHRCPTVVKASKDEISMMREWARSHGSSVRQKRVQQATMARAGTLPDFCTKRKSKLEKESTFLQTVWQPQTSAQYPASLMQKTKLPSTIQTEMKKFVRLKILRRRVLVAWKMSRSPEMSIFKSVEQKNVISGLKMYFPSRPIS